VFSPASILVGSQLLGDDFNYQTIFRMMTEEIEKAISQISLQELLVPVKNLGKLLLG